MGEASSFAAAFAGVGLGVLSGSGSFLTFFLPEDFFLRDLALLPVVFFFLLFEFAEVLFDFFAAGVARRFPPSSSSSLDFDFVGSAGDFFGLERGGSSSLSSAFDFDELFFGAGVGLFFFFGEDFGVAVAEARCFGLGVLLGVSSSLTWPCNRDAMSARIAKAVAMQRRKRATSSAP